jgi:molybdate/tungstate transport system ATP-binding protein
MLILKNISVEVGNFRLKNVSFTVEKGEYFVILGPSGVGKSLLLETIAGLWRPSSGTIALRGRNITSERIQNRNISIVYQDSDLFPHMSVRENIAYPLKSRGEANIAEKVLRAAEMVGIQDKFHRKPATLSGGEYQRVSLARSIAADPDIVLLDEPLSSLDSKACNELRALLRAINRRGITVVHVTHDYEEAIAVATKIGIMENGELVHVDSPEEIFRHPKSEFIAHFIGIKNFFKGIVRSIAGKDLKAFLTDGTTIFCLTDIADGEAFLALRPDEISISNAKEESSSRNHFKGKIIDIAPARLGLEVTVDVGCEIVSIISSDALRSLRLRIGKDVWINFKASSCKVYASDRVKT